MILVGMVNCILFLPKSKMMMMMMMMWFIPGLRAKQAWCLISGEYDLWAGHLCSTMFNFQFYVGYFTCPCCDFNSILIKSCLIVQNFPKIFSFHLFKVFFVFFLKANFNDLCHNRVNQFLIWDSVFLVGHKNRLLTRHHLFLAFYWKNCLNFSKTNFGMVISTVASNTVWMAGPHESQPCLN